MKGKHQRRKGNLYGAYVCDRESQWILLDAKLRPGNPHGHDSETRARRCPVFLATMCRTTAKIGVWVVFRQPLEGATEVSDRIRHPLPPAEYIPPCPENLKIRSVPLWRLSRH